MRSAGWRRDHLHRSRFELIDEKERYAEEPLAILYRSVIPDRHALADQIYRLPLSRRQFALTPKAGVRRVAADMERCLLPPDWLMLRPALRVMKTKYLVMA